VISVSLDLAIVWALLSPGMETALEFWPRQIGLRATGDSIQNGLPDPAFGRLAQCDNGLVHSPLRI
jgi:hypothetical protein